MRQSPALQVIDDAFLTRRRIARDVQTALSILFLAIMFAVHRLTIVMMVGTAFVVASVLVQLGARRLLDAVLPQPVRARLPYGPLDATEISGAPHGYRDLFRIWRDPDWQCDHRPELRAPVSASGVTMTLPVIALFVMAALAIAGEMALEAPRAVAAMTIAAQAIVAVVWNRILRARSLDLPTTGDVWTVFTMAAMAVLAGLAIAWAH